MTNNSSTNKTENIFSLTDKILKDVAGLELSANSNTIPQNKKAIDSITRDFLLHDDANYSYPVNGSVDCNVTGDQMKAYLSLYPPDSGMAFIKEDDIRTELLKSAVVYGILWEEIEKAVHKCNLEHVAIEGLLAAQGTLAQNEIPRHYLLEDKLLSKPEINPDNQTRIDYKQISPFILVSKGERLGTIISGHKGKNGTNVLGATLTFKIEECDIFIFGQNITEVDSAFFSTIDGVFEKKGRKLNVQEVLFIQNNVDYHTGNIDFSGDVIINGEVQEGFNIKAGGSIYAEHALDAKNLECGENLYVKYGIIGRREGLLQIRGTVKAKFIENTLLETGGNVDIASSILRSSIYTGGSIQCGPRGMIIGGTYFAQNGVRANQIGSDCAPHTEIYCGLDYTIMKQLNWNKEQSLNLALALQKLRKMILDAQTNEQKAELSEKFNNIRSAISKLNTISTNLIFQLDKNEAATIEVTGKIYPGVYLEICHVSYVVKKIMNSVRFSLDKDTGTIKAEKFIPKLTENTVIV